MTSISLSKNVSGPSQTGISENVHYVEQSSITIPILLRKAWIKLLSFMLPHTFSSIKNCLKFQTVPENSVFTPLVMKVCLARDQIDDRKVDAIQDRIALGMVYKR